AALPTTVPLVTAQENVLSSATFDFDKLSVEENDHAQIRHIMKGKLATGESVEVHESTLPPNGYPHSPHHYPPSEMYLMRDATVWSRDRGSFSGAFTRRSRRSSRTSGPERRQLRRSRFLLCSILRCRNRTVGSSFLL